jgi:uncharacterized membrane protein
MNDKTRHWLLQIFATKIGWLVISALSAITFGILGNYYEWAAIAMYISFVYPVVLFLIMMVYAWIINPIRDYKESKALKEKYKKK